jgi:hypothetical protein
VEDIPVLRFRLIVLDMVFAINAVTAACALVIGMVTDFMQLCHAITLSE